MRGGQLEGSAAAASSAHERAAAGGAGSGSGSERNRTGQRTSSSWVAIVCTVSALRESGSNWLGEVVRLAACVNAQLVSSLVAGTAPAESEAKSKRWLSTDIFRKGARNPTKSARNTPLRCVPDEMGAEEVCRILKILPGRPNALRQNACLDEVEGAAACAMLHHLHLLPEVRERLAAGGTWDMTADADVVSALRRVAAAASKVRRNVMMQRDTQQASASQDVGPSQSSSPPRASCTPSELTPLPAGWSSGAAMQGDTPTGYEALCAPVISRAILLQQFVSAISGEVTLRESSRQNPRQPDSPSESPACVSGGTSVGGTPVGDTSLGAPGKTGDGSPSPLKRWQNAALKVVTRGAKRAGGGGGALAAAESLSEALQRDVAGPLDGPEAGYDTPTNTPVKSRDTPTCTPVEDGARAPLQSDTFPPAPAPTPMRGTQGSEEEKDARTGWAAVMPLLRLHRACWRLKQLNKRQEDGIIDLVVRFVVSDVVPSSLESALSHRESRCWEVELG